MNYIIELVNNLLRKTSGKNEYKREEKKEN